jgi:hypothetical protein
MACAVVLCGLKYRVRYGKITIYHCFMGKQTHYLANRQGKSVNPSFSFILDSNWQVEAI